MIAANGFLAAAELRKLYHWEALVARINKDAPAPPRRLLPQVDELDRQLGISRYTTRTLHGSAMLGPSQPYPPMYLPGGGQPRPTRSTWPKPIGKRNRWVFMEVQTLTQP